MKNSLIITLMRKAIDTYRRTPSNQSDDLNAPNNWNDQPRLVSSSEEVGQALFNFCAPAIMPLEFFGKSHYYSPIAPQWHKSFLQRKAPHTQNIQHPLAHSYTEVVTSFTISYQKLSRRCIITVISAGFYIGRAELLLLWAAVATHYGPKCN